MKFHSICKILPYRLNSFSEVTIIRFYSHSRKKPFEDSRLSSREIRAMEKKLRQKRQMAHLDKYKKKLTSVPVSTVTSLTVVSAGANGLGRSVLLKTNTDRYLFNCGEGVQKVFTDIVTRLGPVDNIFFTYNTWNNVGGIMGFLLSNTTDIMHANTIVLHGPPNVDKILENTRMFSGSSVGQLAQVVWQGIDKVKHEDDQLIIEYVELLSRESNVEKEQEKTSEHFQKKASPGKSPKKAEMKMDNEENFEKAKPVMAYIIKLKPLPRKVDTEKLLALNAKSGPWIKQLVSGEAVTLEDGRTVTPDDVLMESDSDLGPIIVLDCPTEDYLDSLTTSRQLLDLSSEGSRKPLVIVHMAPVLIIEDQRYKDFMDRFDSDTLHLMLNENSPGPYVHSSQIFQSSLNYLHPGIFPLLQGSVNYNTQPKPQTGNVIQACYGLNFDVRPVRKRGFNWDSLLYFDQEARFTEVKRKAEMDAIYLVRKLSCNEEIARLMSFQKKDIDDEIMKLRSKLLIQGESDTSEEYPEIIFLGTGSAKPALHRNASAILVQMRKDEYMLMDCGEGTLLQMYQMFGLEKTHHILANLKGIFISHLHFDHHGGLFGVLEARLKAVGQNESSDRLTIFAPIPLKKWFYIYSRCVSQIELEVEFIPHHIIYEAVKSRSESNYVTLAKNVLGISEFVVMPVIHTSNSFGLSIRHRDGWKLVYSGDSMPCQELVRHGKDCDILIHEGTFDDQSMEDASFKKHSTTSQAIEIGRKMNAKFILLTHFSQRFSKIPEFTEKFTENVGFAFDFMQLRPSQLWLIPLFKPALNLMYSPDLQCRIMNTRRRQLEENASKNERQEFVEKTVTDKKLANELFFEKQRKDMEVWAKMGRDLKSKLQDSQEEKESKEQTNRNESDDDHRGEISKESTVEASNKRKVHSNKVGNKVRKTERNNDSVASTSNETGDVAGSSGNT